MKNKGSSHENITHISYEEWVLIRSYQEEVCVIYEVARYLGRSKSTISREISRNSNRSGYILQTAEKRYRVRRQKPRKIDNNPGLKGHVLNGPYVGISPGMIALRLKKLGHLENIPSIIQGSIYRWLYRAPQKKEKLYKLLVQNQGRRGRRRRVSCAPIKHRTSVHERPQHILTPKEVGHWEGDLMSIKGNKQHLLFLHEGTTRYTATFL